MKLEFPKEEMRAYLSTICRRIKDLRKKKTCLSISLVLTNWSHNSPNL